MKSDKSQSPFTVPPAPTIAASVAPTATPASRRTDPTQGVASDVLDLLAQLLENSSGILLSDTPELAEEADRLVATARSASQMVRHDPLTGALNRKGMNDALETEVARTHRHNSSLCLALLDIDNFKKLNDTLGHAAGDAALVHLAQVVHEAIRPEDTLARYGGEEFVVILPGTPLDNAVSIMVRV